MDNLWDGDEDNSEEEDSSEESDESQEIDTGAASSTTINADRIDLNIELLLQWCLLFVTLGEVQSNDTLL